MDGQTNGWATVERRQLRFCAHCTHQHIMGSMFALASPKCHHPISFQGGDIDLVSGADRRRWRSCSDMRHGGPCGQAGVLHSSAQRDSGSDPEGEDTEGG